MKFGVLFLAVLAIFPLALLMRSTPMLRKPFWIAFGALPFLSSTIPMYDIGIVTLYGSWIGFVYSLEVTVVDLLAVVGFFSLAPGRLPLWCRLPFIAYIAAVALSLLQAELPLAASFGLLQFARIYLVMVVVARAAQADPEVPFLILKGMAFGFMAHLPAVLHQRFVQGLTQTMGLFIHQNLLGMSAHFVLLPHLALLLAGHRNIRYLVAVVLGTLMVVVFTASRATVAFAAVGVVTLLLVQALAGLSQRKMAIVAAAFAGMVVVAPLTLATFQNRFDHVPLAEDVYDERGAFNRAASFILEDHPLGVGINHYVRVARDFGYSERAGVANFEGNRNNIVHSAYWLSGAETGYPGVVTLCIMLLVPLVVALRSGWRMRASLEGNLLIGFAVTLFVVYFHSGYEWVLFAKEIQYPLGMTMGMIFGVVLRLAAAERRDRRAGAESRMPLGSAA